MSERLDQVERILVGLAERQSDTEEKLNAFVASVHDFEDHILAGHKQLLTAQVLMVDEFQKLAKAQRQAEIRRAAAEARSAEAQAHTDEKLKDLIRIVDDIIRHRPQA